MDVLQRDYLIEDLRAVTAAAGVTRTVAVQAQQAVAETRWLLDLAERDATIAGVVGWVPLVDPAVPDLLAELGARPHLRGVRHILHDEPDDEYMLRPDFNRGVAALQAHGLVYDVLVFARHLPHVLAFVDRHPGQPFVVDHIAKPVIRADRFDTDWASRLRELARRPHVACKLSGVVTEVRDASWTPASIRPYLDAAFEAFGPSRLMFGTDWPVCLLRCTYGEWTETVLAYVAALSPDEREAILGGTAARVYGLG